MKSVNLLLVCLALAGCRETYDNTEAARTKESLSTRPAEARLTTNLEAKVIVNLDRNEIQVLRGFPSDPGGVIRPDGSMSEFECGFDLVDGTVISYDFSEDWNLRLQIGDRDLLLSRVRPSHGSPAVPVYGDWVYTEYGRNFSRRWTFFIRDSEILNVEASCFVRYE
jgi:hypothetical protein